MNDIQQLSAAIRELEDAIQRLRKEQFWSAYKEIDNAKWRLQSVKQSCAGKSIRCAMSWGNTFRFEDGKLGMTPP